MHMPLPKSCGTPSLQYRVLTSSGDFARTPKIFGKVFQIAKSTASPHNHDGMQATATSKLPLQGLEDR